MEERVNRYGHIMAVSVAEATEVYSKKLLENLFELTTDRLVVYSASQQSIQNNFQLHL